MNDQDDEDGYCGPATLTVCGREFTLNVRLAGYFQPLDGRYRWYGRVDADEELSTLVEERTEGVVVRTPQGDAEGQLTEPDLWRRYRIQGVSTPPYRVPATLAELDLLRNRG